MKTIIFTFFSVVSFVFSQNPYCAGEQVELNHQNQEFEVCYASGDYSIGDYWKLSDYNGDLNGGNYHIIFIDMSATW